LVATNRAHAVRNILTQSAVAFGLPAGDNAGAGLADAYRAIQASDGAQIQAQSAAPATQ